LHHLQDHFYKNTHRNLFLTGELLRLLNLFEAQGIFAIPYKGPALAAVAYGNLALREFADLDILIRKQDVQRAKELLTSAGYRPEDRLTRAQEAALLRNTHEHAFRRDDKGLVDLHWGVVERHFSFPLDPERLWERLERVSLGGATPQPANIGRVKGVQFDAVARALKPGGRFLIFDEAYPETDEALRTMPTRFAALAQRYEVPWGNMVNTRSELHALCRERGCRSPRRPGSPVFISWWRGSSADS
jgi:hypothetical protein